MIRVIAFDLDDTLWHVDPVIRRAEAVLGNWFRTRIKGFDYDMRNMGSFRQAVIAEEPHLLSRITDLRRRVIGMALVDHGVEAATIDEIMDEAMEVFLTARNEIEFFAGALEAIAELSEEFTLGALTNGNADIVRLGLDDHFTFSFSAEDVGAPKPAPDLFQAALEHTGVPPDEMIYVGDDPVKDVDTAKTVGLRTIWLRNELRPGPGKSDPDYIIDDIRELPAAVRKLNAR